MGYQRGMTAQPMVTVQSVEQARRRNAELRIELASLTAENTQLEARVATARLRVSEARRLLTRKIRDLDTIRAQVDRLPAVPVTGLPEPTYGGREGLLAAADEMEAHEAQGLMFYKPRVRKGPSHGTRDRYATGCKCDLCLGWRRKRTDQETARQRRQRASQKAAA